jgi:hypothetical protein
VRLYFVGSFGRGARGEEGSGMDWRWYGMGWSGGEG